MKFVLTPEHFERARSQLDAAEEKIKAERVKLTELERNVAKFAATFEPVGPDTLDERAPEKSIKPKKLPERSLPAKAAAHNRPYSPEQIETLRTASREDLPKLAEQWGRTFNGVEKKREELRAIKWPQAAPEPSPPQEKAPVFEDVEDGFVADSSEELVGKAIQNQGWNPSGRSVVRPGIPVEGLVDSGPEHKRIYDERAFSSKWERA